MTESMLAQLFVIFKVNIHCQANICLSVYYISHADFFPLIHIQRSWFVLSFSFLFSWFVLFLRFLFLFCALLFVPSIHWLYFFQCFFLLFCFCFFSIILVIHCIGCILFFLSSCLVCDLVVFEKNFLVNKDGTIKGVGHQHDCMWVALKVPS